MRPIFLLALCLALPFAAVADEITPLPNPCRLYDSRNIGGAGVGNKISTATIEATDPGLDAVSFTAGGIQYNGQGGQSGCRVPEGATGIIANVVAYQPSGAGYARLWAAGSTEPISTTLTFSSGQTDETSGALVHLGTNGDISVHVAYTTAHVIIDVTGWTNELCLCDTAEMLISKRTISSTETRARLMSDRWTVTTATQHSGYPSSKLLTDNLADFWLAYGQRESQTWISAVSDVAVDDREIGAVSILGINRDNPTQPPASGSYGSNYWRVRFDSFPLADRARPGIASVTNLVNLTGTLPDISGALDPPTAPLPVGYTASRLESTNPALGTAVRVTFDNHYATERALSTLPNGQLIRVFVADSANAATQPTITATIVPSSGSSFGLTAGFGNIEKVAGEGYIFNYFWSRSDLTVPTATVRLDIAGTSTGSSTPEIIGVEWVAELDGLVYDSNFQGLPAGARLLPAVTIPSGQTYYMLATFSDFVVATSVSPGVFSMAPIGGSFHAGRLVACETFEIDVANDGWTYAPQTDAEEVMARDGSVRFPRSSAHWDEYQLEAADFRSSELAVDEMLLELYRSVDVRYPFLVIPHLERPQDDRFVRFVPGTFELQGGGVKASGDGTGTGRKWKLTATLKEHTARTGIRG